MSPTAITLYGPNGVERFAKGRSFVAHAAGCADCKRIERNAHVERSMSLEASSRHEVGNWIYSDHIAEGMDAGSGTDDVHFAPCLKALPLGGERDGLEGELPTSSDDAMLAADTVIAELAEALVAAGVPASGRLASGSSGSAQVCFRDAEACFGRGDYAHAIERAERGLSHLVGEVPAGTVESLAEGLELAAEFHAAERTLPERAFVERALDVMQSTNEEPTNMPDPTREHLLAEARRLGYTSPSMAELSLPELEDLLENAGASLGEPLDEQRRRLVDTAVEPEPAGDRPKGVIELVLENAELRARVENAELELNRARTDLRRQLELKAELKAELERCQLGNYPPPTPEGA